MEDQKLGDKVKYRATNNLITHQVAGMLINGMWGTTDPFPLLVQVSPESGLNVLRFLVVIGITDNRVRPPT